MNTLSLFLLAVLAATVLTGCGKDTPSFSLLSDGDSFTQGNASFNNQLDILFVVDNSGSMQPYQDNLANNFNSFIQAFVTKGYDFKIAVTSTQAYLSNAAHTGNSNYARFSDGYFSHTGIRVITPSTPNLTNVFMTNVRIGTNGAGDERAFSSFREALNNPVNSGFLRNQAFLSVIILSDEDDFSGDGRCQNCGTSHNYNAATLDPVASYLTQLDQITRSTAPYRRYNVNAIAVIDQACYQANQGTGSIMGVRYMDLVGRAQGLLGSICDTSFATTLNAMQSNIAELSTQFYLERIPDPATIIVKVNGALVPNNAVNGWIYIASSNSIMFKGSAVPPQGATIQVNYTPATIQH